MLDTIAYVLATLAILLIFAGLATARRRKQHIRFMVAAFVCDMIGLVLVEFGPMLGGEKDPVSTVMTEPNTIMVIHATLSTIVLVCYFLQIASGMKIVKGDRSKLIGHKQVAKVFLVARIAAYVTMFMV